MDSYECWLYICIVCVCVGGSLSDLFILLVIYNGLYPPGQAPALPGKGSPDKRPVSRHQSAIGQLETDAVAEGFRRLRQEKSSTAISKLSAEPALASTAPDATRGFLCPQFCQ